MLTSIDYPEQLESAMTGHRSFVCTVLALFLTVVRVTGDNQLYLRQTSIVSTNSGVVSDDFLAPEERALKAKGKGTGKGSKGKERGEGNGAGRIMEIRSVTKQPRSAPEPTNQQASTAVKPTTARQESAVEPTKDQSITADPTTVARDDKTTAVPSSTIEPAFTADPTVTREQPTTDEPSSHFPTVEPTAREPTLEPTSTAMPTMGPTSTIEPTHNDLSSLVSEEESAEDSVEDALDDAEDDLDDIQDGLDRMKKRIKSISKDTGRDRKKTKDIDRTTRKTNNIGVDVRFIGKKNVNDTRGVNKIVLENQAIGLKVKELHIEIIRELDELINTTLAIHDELRADIKVCECADAIKRRKMLLIDDLIDEVDGLNEDLDDVKDGLDKTTDRNKDLKKDLRSEKGRTKEIKQVTDDTNVLSSGTKLIFRDIGNVTRVVNEIGLENQEIGLVNRNDLLEALEQLEAVFQTTVTIKLRLKDEFGDCLCGAVAGIPETRRLQIDDLRDALDDFSDNLDEINDSVDNDNDRLKDNRKRTSKDLKETKRLNKITDDNNLIFRDLDEGADRNSKEITIAVALYLANQELAESVQEAALGFLESIEKIKNETEALRKENICGESEVQLDADGVAPWTPENGNTAARINATGVVAELFTDRGDTTRGTKELALDKSSPSGRKLQDFGDVGDTIDDINDSVDDNNDRLKDINRDNSKDLKDLKKIKRVTDDNNNLARDIDIDGEKNLREIKEVEAVVKANQLILLETRELYLTVVNRVEELVNATEDFVKDLDDPSSLC